MIQQLYVPNHELSPELEHHVSRVDCQRHVAHSLPDDVHHIILRQAVQRHSVDAQYLVSGLQPAVLRC